MERTSTRKRKSKYAAPIGGAYIILACVGVVAVIMGAMNMFTSLTDDSKLLRKLERQIMPIMMYDPVPFDSFEGADETVVVKSAIWSTLLSDKREKYTYDDNGLMLIPVSDIDVAIAKLFGPDAKIQHKSFSDYDYTFVYDPENNMYRVPIMTQTGYYTPLVTELKRQGDFYNMTVGYVPPGAEWLTDDKGNKYQPKPDKTMTYKMKKKDGEYYIVAIIDLGEAQPQSQSSSPS